MTMPPPGNDPYQPYGQPSGEQGQPDQFGQPSGQYGQYGQYGQPVQPYGYQAPPPTNGMAIASMVVSIVSLVSICLCGFTGLAGIVGAILGHVSRKQIRERHENGAGMALAGVIVGWISFAIVLVGIALIVVLIATGEDFDSPTYY